MHINKKLSNKIRVRRVKKGSTYLYYYYKISNDKKIRISESDYVKLTKQQPYLKFRKAKPKEYTSRKRIQQILNKKSKANILILCHGTQHKKYRDLPKYTNAILLDINIYAKPDIIGNFYNTRFVSRLPKNYFNKVIMVHCPIFDPTSNINKKLFKNIVYVLKSGGKLYDKSIPWLYHIRNNFLTPDQARSNIVKYLTLFFNDVKIYKKKTIKTKFGININDKIVMTKYS